MSLSLELRSEVGFVTSSYHKVEPVVASLPRHDVLWIFSRAGDEKKLSVNLPLDRNRSVAVVYMKAINWAGEESIVWLFNDLTQISDGKVFEKALSDDDWLRQVLWQSGKEVTISASFAAKKNKLIRTGTVEEILYTRSFTKEDVIAHAEKVGLSKMKDASGGLPIVFSEPLFDHDRDVRRRFTDNDSGRTSELDVLPWSRINHQVLSTLATGAHPVALAHLVNAVQ